MSRPSRRTTARDVSAPAPPPGALPSALCGLAAFALYAWLTPAVPGDKDAAEFTLVLAKLGSAHPTGYPLYTLTGHAFVTLLHAAGMGFARAANLWSALGGGLAMALLHALAARLLAREGVVAPRALLLALLPVLAVGAQPLVTAETTLAEVNAWHLAWVAGMALASGPLFAATERGDAPPTHAVAGFGCLAGVGLAHHVTSVFVTLPLAVALAFAAARAGVKLARPLGLALAASLPPLSAYAFLAWRAFHPGVVQWPSLDASWSSVWAHVSGAEFRIYLGKFAPAPEQAALLTRTLWPWLVPLLAAMLVWALRAPAVQRAHRAGLTLAALLAAAYARSYGVPDPGSYFLPPLLLAAAAAPALVAGVAPLRRAAPVLAAAAVLLVAWSAVNGVRESYERSRGFEAFEQRVHRMWREVPFDSGYVMWLNDMVNLLHVYQVLDGERTGLRALHPIELTHDRPRQAFVREHGFDPASQQRIGPRVAEFRPTNVDELSRAVGLAVSREIADRQPLPVLIFMPERGDMVPLRSSTADTLAAR